MSPGMNLGKVKRAYRLSSLYAWVVINAGFKIKSSQQTQYASQT